MIAGGGGGGGGGRGGVPTDFSSPTIANNTNTRELYCWQWANFTMGPNEQSQHLAELRQKVC